MVALGIGISGFQFANFLGGLGERALGLAGGEGAR